MHWRPTQYHQPAHQPARRPAHQPARQPAHQPIHQHSHQPTHDQHMIKTSTVINQHNHDQHINTSTNTREHAAHTVSVLHCKKVGEMVS